MKKWYVLRFVRASEREDPAAAVAAMPVEAEEGELEAVKEDWAMQLEEQTGVPWVCREVAAMFEGRRSR